PIILKPSPYTPATALLMAEYCTQAGVPAGMVQILTGPDVELGKALVAHPGVDKISFTGSTHVGKAVMKSAADTVKDVTLELGGKSANIILDDANLDGAIPGSLFGTFFHSGQVCESGTRILVSKAMHDSFVEQLVATAG
ncbi:MAG: aldehyde dehydrogenase family protein, partial [Myxococcota bacterium]